METKHTPGPWTVHTCGTDSYPVHEIDAGYRRIATVEPVEDGTDECPLPEGQIEANARLIAAAPDLLEALIGAVEVMNHSEMRSRQTWQQRARAAISRATAD